MHRVPSTPLFAAAVGTPIRRPVGPFGFCLPDGTKSNEHVLYPFWFKPRRYPFPNAEPAREFHSSFLGNIRRARGPERTLGVCCAVHYANVTRQADELLTNRVCLHVFSIIKPKC